MALLDFIKNRQQQPAEASQQKPETAKEMYSREASEGRAGQKPVEQIPDNAKSAARDLGARLDNASQPIQQTGPAQASAPEGASGPEPMRQKMTAQDKDAPELSPTSGQMGQTANEKEAAPAQESSEKSQRPTIARPTPSWER